MLDDERELVVGHLIKDTYCCERLVHVGDVSYIPLSSTLADDAKYLESISLREEVQSFESVGKVLCLVCHLSVSLPNVLVGALIFGPKHWPIRDLMQVLDESLVESLYSNLACFLVLERKHLQRVQGRLV